MLRYIACTLLLAYALATPSLLDLDRDWAIFKLTHDKQHSEGDDLMRRAIWVVNLQMIEQHNLEADRGVHSYRLGMNHLGDMTRQEIVSKMNGYKMNPNRTVGATYMAPSNVGDLPPTVDWRIKGFVTPVKDQGQCRSCWAFSATGSLEGQHFKQTGQLVSLSEQNLVDCSTKEGNHGCKGGRMDNAFSYIKINQGIDTETSYPYTAKDQKCRFTHDNIGATVTGHTNIKQGSETDLKSAVATVGPISVAIHASRSTFHFYKSGLYNDPPCNDGDLDHAVLVVGYGTDTTNGEYWLVKNSWGAAWGDHGYMYTPRNKGNACGIASDALYPLV